MKNTVDDLFIEDDIDGKNNSHCELLLSPCHL
jgi:hypothetical protein